MISWLGLLCAFSVALGAVNFHVLDGHSHHDEQEQVSHHHDHFDTVSLSCDDFHHSCCLHDDHLPVSDTVEPFCTVGQSKRLLRLKPEPSLDWMVLYENTPHRVLSYTPPKVRPDNGLSVAPEMTRILRI